jgi:uncharacterized protein YndB with AHSA1/START domain
VHLNQHSVEIEAAPEVVWDWLVEPDRLVQWVGGLRRFEPLGDGVPGPGMRSQQHLHLGGRDWVLASEIVRWDPPNELEAHSEQKGFRIGQAYRLERIDGRTQLECRVRTELKGLVGRLLEGVVSGRAQHKLEHDLDRLKRLAESSAPSGDAA